MNNLTLEWLRHHNACSDGIKFAIRSQLIGFPFELLNDIKGDYNNFVAWTRQALTDELVEFDDNNNCTCIREWDGYFQYFKFDERGNRIYENNTGEEFTCTYEYDDSNKLISKTDSYDGTTIFTYDQKDRLIMTQYQSKPYSSTLIEYDDHDNISQMSYPGDYRTVMTYDSHGNVITTQYFDQMDTHYRADEYIVTYYPDGQLKQYDDLYVPYFEKN